MPNVVVVLADQMRRDALSCAGNANLRTPHLDRLAQRGVRFTAACATFPACVPFRFSLLTGEYAHSRNVPALGYRLSPAERTLGDALEAAGLATAYIGKWHLYSAYGVSGGMNLSQASRTPIPASHRRGFDHWQGFELRNDFEDTWIFEGDDPRPRHLPGHQTDALFDLALGYLEHGRPAAQPFFLMLSVEAPHPPFMATAETLARVRARGPLQHRINVDLAAIRFFPPEWHEATGPAGGSTRRPGLGAASSRPTYRHCDDRADRRQYGPAPDRARAARPRRRHDHRLPRRSRRVTATGSSARRSHGRNRSASR